MIELLNMDCMTYLRDCPDNTFDIVITSPPYNLGDIHHTGNSRTRHYADNLPEAEYQAQQIKLLDELRRVIRPSGSLFYNHKNRIRDGRTISPLEWILKSGWVLKQEIVWRNKGQNFDKVKAFPATERVYWLAEPSVKMQNEVGLTDCVLENRWPPVQTGGAHGRAFPIQLVTQILSCFPDTKTMYDPFLGSGTCAIAAHYFGCDFVGTEIDPDYFAAARARFDNETRQVALL